MSVSELTYNITTLELFSLWNAIIHKVELQNKKIEENNRKNGL